MRILVFNLKITDSLSVLLSHMTRFSVEGSHELLCFTESRDSFCSGAFNVYAMKKDWVKSYEMHGFESSTEWTRRHLWDSVRYAQGLEEVWEQIHPDVIIVPDWHHLLVFDLLNKLDEVVFFANHLSMYWNEHPIARMIEKDEVERVSHILMPLDGNTVFMDSDRVEGLVETYERLPESDREEFKKRRLVTSDFSYESFAKCLNTITSKSMASI